MILVVTFISEDNFAELILCFKIVFLVLMISQCVFEVELLCVIGPFLPCAAIILMPELSLGLVNNVLSNLS